LSVRNGSVVEARDLAAGESVVDGSPVAAGRERRSPYDRSRYDRLRTLTTELKRVLKDGGSAEVRVGRSRWLRGTQLHALLRWV
jgi:hypothetical protein